MYQISNLGRVKSLRRLIYNNGVSYWCPEIIMVNTMIGKYFSVGLSKNNIKKTIRIHRLVAKTFIPNPLNKPQINHINGIKTDNRLENLEWCNASENQLHAIKLGLVKKNRRYLRPTKKVIQKDKLGNVIKLWESNKQITINTNYRKEYIIACCNKRAKTAYGYVWEYVSN